jgi:quercetin dioxygenase-like cupin family protein
MSGRLSPSFPASYDPSSERVILTPSAFAKEHLIYVQETGRLRLLEAKHVTSRKNLDSYLLVSVLGGEGTLEYQGNRFSLRPGLCFWIDCREAHRYYSSKENPWELVSRPHRVLPEQF